MFIVIILCLAPVVYSQIGIFCTDWEANSRRFDFGTHDMFNTDSNKMVHLVYIGNTAWRIQYNNTGAPHIYMSPKIADISHYQQQYTMSFVYRDSNNTFWRTYYKENKPEMDILDIKDIENLNRNTTPNVWTDTTQFKPSVAFGPLNGDIPANTAVFVVQQTLKEGVYERVTKYYDWDTSTYVLTDRTSIHSDMIPKFIQTLDPKLHINVIFPFHSQNKYAIVFSGDSDPKGCLSDRDAAPQECQIDGLTPLTESCSPTSSAKPDESTIQSIITTESTTKPINKSANVLAMKWIAEPIPTTDISVNQSPTESVATESDTNLPPNPVSGAAPIVASDTSEPIVTTTDPDTLKSFHKTPVMPIVGALVASMVVLIVIVVLIMLGTFMFGQNGPRNVSKRQNTEKIDILKSNPKKDLVLPDIDTVDSVTGEVVVKDS